MLKIVLVKVLLTIRITIIQFSISVCRVAHDRMLTTSISAIVGSLGHGAVRKFKALDIIMWLLVPTLTRHSFNSNVMFAFVVIRKYSIFNICRTELIITTYNIL